MKALLGSNHSATAAMWAASLALTVFWKANILKEAYPGVKSVLNFYSPVGPLLGLFTLAIVVFLLTWVILVKTDTFTSKISDRLTFWVYSAATVLFFLMVFPPFFEPLVELLAGK